MPQLAAFEGLPFFDQFLHGIHFMLCSFAILIASIPALTSKGSVEHKFGGMLYVPVSLAALLLASGMAWREQSLLLFCFNAFCAYLLMSGWRAVHEKEAPAWIDWIIPAGLFALAVIVALDALMADQGAKTFYLLMFTLNAVFLAHRDWRHLRRRSYSHRFKVFFANQNAGKPMEWLNRHVTGMVGSVMANLSVVVLTLLPLSLHWLWPTSLILMAACVAYKQQQKKRKLRAAMAPFMPKPRPLASPFLTEEEREEDEDLRRVA